MIKKSALIALLPAMLAMLAMINPAAAADASVTLYGIADAGPFHGQYKYSRKGLRVSNTTDRGLKSGIMNSSRVGLKGSEDLGGGTKFQFNLESKIGLEDGAGGDWKRQAWLGLSNKRWGSFTMGRQKDVADNLFKIETTRGLGKASRTFGGKGGRHDSLFKYVSPGLGGFKGGIAYARGTSNDKYKHYWSLGAQYSHGPLLFSGAYNIDKLRAGYSVKNWALGATWDFRILKLAAGYGQDRNGKLNKPGSVDNDALGPISGAAGLGAYNQRGFKSKNYYLGASAPLGPGEFGAAWGRSSSNLGRLAGMDGGTQNILVAQYQYFLSKRTRLFAYAAHGKNMAYVRGLKRQEFGLGMQHRF